MFLTVYRTGNAKQAARYLDKSTIKEILDNCLGEEIFTVEADDEETLVEKALNKARQEKIYFVRYLDT